MKDACKILGLMVLLLFTSCEVPSENSCVHNQEIGQPQTSIIHPQNEFQCRNGQKFSITFLKETAALTIGNITQDLKNSHIASGVEYTGSDYTLREYEGRVTLTDLTQGKETTTTCHAISQK